MLAYYKPFRGGFSLHEPGESALGLASACAADDDSAKVSSRFRTTNSSESLPDLGRERVVFDRNGGSWESSPHQHGVLRLLDEPRGLFSVRSRIAPLSEPAGKPFDGHDDLPVLPGLGRTGTGGPALRYRTASCWAAGRPRQEGLRDSVPGIQEMAQEPDSTRTSTGLAVALLCVLPVSAGPGEDPGRVGIRRGALRRRKDQTSSGPGEVPTCGSETAEDGDPCAGKKPTPEGVSPREYRNTQRLWRQGIRPPRPWSGFGRTSSITASLEQLQPTPILSGLSRTRDRSGDVNVLQTRKFKGTEDYPSSAVRPRKRSRLHGETQEAAEAVRDRDPP